MELFKDSYIFPEAYTVSNKGRIKNKITNKYRNPSYDKDGYLYLTLRSNGESKFMRVHRLVALTFIENDDPKNKIVINHKNGIKDDNRVDNLEWCTISYNTKHSFDNGFQEKPKGIKHGRHKYSEEQIHNVCKLISDRMVNKEISNRTGVSLRTIESIRSRSNWTHISKDYVFEDRRRKNL